MCVSVIFKTFSITSRRAKNVRAAGKENTHLIKSVQKAAAAPEQCKYKDKITSEEREKIMETPSRRQ